MFILRSPNKITYFLMILAWASPFKPIPGDIHAKEIRVPVVYSALESRLGLKKTREVINDQSSASIRIMPSSM